MKKWKDDALVAAMTDPKLSPHLEDKEFLKFMEEGKKYPKDNLSKMPPEDFNKLFEGEVSPLEDLMVPLAEHILEHIKKEVEIDGL